MAIDEEIGSLERAARAGDAEAASKLAALARRFAGSGPDASDEGRRDGPRILKPGRRQTGWTTEATCTGGGNGGGGCGAELLVEQPHLYRTSRSSYDGDTEHFTTFRCPACGVETDIKDAKVPWHVSQKLPSKAVWFRDRGLSA